MLRRSFVAIASLLFAALPTHANATTPVEWGSILVYQAEILETVLPNEDELGEYIDRLQETAESQAQGSSVRAAGVLFVALAPDGRKRVWLLPTSGVVLPDVIEQWEEALSAVEGMPVRHYFVFGLSFGVGGVRAYQAFGAPPIPADWEARIPPDGAMLDDAFISRAWPAGG